VGVDQKKEILVLKGGYDVPWTSRELPRNSLKLRCSFDIMELELNRSVSGEVPEAYRNTIYEVKKGNIR
jgi:hypothetical protein